MQHQLAVSILNVADTARDAAVIVCTASTRAGGGQFRVSDGGWGGILLLSRVIYSARCRSVLVVIRLEQCTWRHTVISEGLPRHRTFPKLLVRPLSNHFLKCGSGIPFILIRIYNRFGFAVVSGQGPTDEASSILEVDLGLRWPPELGVPLNASCIDICSTYGTCGRRV